MTRLKSLQISPRIVLYDAETPMPSVTGHTLALPQTSSKAFGDGSHPTTRLCAGAVDLLCRQQPSRSVLDVGTGTGLLARIARSRGSSFVVATDIDPIALNAAEANSALGDHSLKILISDQMPDHWGPRFDLVVANILEGPLRELAPSLCGALSPEGILLLSGFTPLQTPLLRVVFTELQLTFISEAVLDGWALLMFRNCFRPLTLEQESTVEKQRLHLKSK